MFFLEDRCSFEKEYIFFQTEMMNEGVGVENEEFIGYKPRQTAQAKHSYCLVFGLILQ